MWYFVGGVLWFVLPFFFVSKLLLRFLSKGKRFSFGIRDFLFVVFYCSICLSWAVPEFSRMRQEKVHMEMLSNFFETPVGYRRGYGLSGFQLLDSIDVSEASILLEDVDELTYLLSEFSNLESVYVSSDTSLECLTILGEKLADVRLIVFQKNFELSQFETVLPGE